MVRQNVYERVIKIFSKIPLLHELAAKIYRISTTRTLQLLAFIDRYSDVIAYNVDAYLCICEWDKPERTVRWLRPTDWIYASANARALGVLEIGGRYDLTYNISIQIARHFYGRLKYLQKRTNKDRGN